MNRRSDGRARVDSAAIGHEDLRRYMEHGRRLRAEAMARTLARGGRLVQKVLAGLLGRGAPGGRGRRWRHAGPCDA